MAAKAKAFTQDMKDQIAGAAHALGGLMPDYSEAAGKTYEAWVLFELAARLQSAGVTVTACDHTGAATNSFRVRGGPGYLHGAAEMGALPCHFLLEDESVHLAELHSSLRHRGLSDDTHELDVSVVDADYAENVRQAGGGPIDVEQGSYRYPAILLGIELKEYESATLPKVYARALLGVAVDLTPPAPVIVMRGRKAFAISPPETVFWLVTTSALGTSAPFLLFHDLGCRGDVQPNGLGVTVLDELASRVARQLTWMP